MNGVNKPVIISAVVITGLGAVHVWTGGQGGLTQVLIGGNLLLIFLSLADLAGGAVSRVVGAIAMLAMVAAILVYGVPILLHLGNLANPQGRTPRVVGPGSSHPQ